ncbi:hypothetical protein PN499_28930 [Kamptonema animale CS-326]|jgi:hypothetical protein|uniref:hypothetical protein n=1 Tax=Kamptonema animale TaxID=92934 RepID=UPI00232DD8D7|nr:hypothetical protein [Kamptonema animale]MDB9515229.1 hypothetical protein [Kamptonema animale CS-326]
MIPFKVDWNQLTQIKELKEYFEEDFTNFQQLIEEEVDRLSWLSQEDLDKIADCGYSKSQMAVLNGDFADKTSKVYR